MNNLDFYCTGDVYSLEQPQQNIYLRWFGKNFQFYFSDYIKKFRINYLKINSEKRICFDGYWVENCETQGFVEVNFTHGRKEIYCLSPTDNNFKSSHDNRDFGILIESFEYRDVHGRNYNVNIKDIFVLDNNNFKNVQITEGDAIKYIGQSGTTGYATAAKGYICDYILKNIPISWQPLNFDDSTNDNGYYVDILCESVIDKKYQNYKRVILHSTPDLWESFINENIKMPEIIGYCTWETNKLPKNWVNYVNLLPEVWVPSHFNKDCFINSGVKSIIKVVPHVWHPQKLFNKNNIKIYDHFKNPISKNKFTFYSIGELNFRKGIQDLVNVFNKINDKYPDTQLILKIHYKNYSVENKKYCINEISKITNKLGKSIHLLLNNLDNKDIISLHSFGDCYVSLNKGEGFGLTIFDAYNYNKKIITTAYGGQTEYLGQDYDGLVKFKMDKVFGMEHFSNNYLSDQEWGYPDLDHAFQIMEYYINKKN